MSDTETPPEPNRYDTLRADLDAARAITHEGRQRNALHDVTGTTLIDIAESLAMVALAARVWLVDAGVLDEPDTTDEYRDDVPPGETTAPAPLDVDEWVVVTEAVQLAAETGEAPTPGLIVNMGVSEGDDWADVSWYGDDLDTPPTRVWRSLLERTDEPTPPETLDGGGPLSDEGDTFEDIDPADLVEYEQPDPTDQVEDDLARDFEGDQHPAADAAVAELTKAERKAAKAARKGKKGGK